MASAQTVAVVMTQVADLLKPMNEFLAGQRKHLMETVGVSATAADDLIVDLGKQLYAACFKQMLS